MPIPGMRWRFVTFGTKNSWLPGDPRGWRSRDHRRHSSGDYKHPPPPGEHDGLRRWVNDRAGNRIIIPRELRGNMGEAILAALSQLGYRAAAISVSGMHCHVVVELPDEPKLIKAIIGEAKRASSRAVKAQMPGELWAGGGDFDPIDDREHLRRAVIYVTTKQGPTAWTWSCRERMPSVKVVVRTPMVRGMGKIRGGTGPTRGGARNA